MGDEREPLTRWKSAAAFLGRSAQGFLRCCSGPVRGVAIVLVLGEKTNHRLQFVGTGDTESPTGHSFEERTIFTMHK